MARHHERAVSGLIEVSWHLARLWVKDMSLSIVTTGLYLRDLAVTWVPLVTLKLAAIVKVDGSAEGLDDDLASGGDPDLT